MSVVVVVVINAAAITATCRRKCTKQYLARREEQWRRWEMGEVPHPNLCLSVHRPTSVNKSHRTETPYLPRGVSNQEPVHGFSQAGRRGQNRGKHNGQCGGTEYQQWIDGRQTLVIEQQWDCCRGSNGHIRIVHFELYQLFGFFSKDCTEFGSGHYVRLNLGRTLFKRTALVLNTFGST